MHISPFACNSKFAFCLHPVCFLVLQHQNTNPEDITICEAYIAFLESSNMDDFWRVAWDAGQITRETLAAMDQVNTKFARLVGIELLHQRQICAGLDLARFGWRAGCRVS